jgi:hypothetical protein
MPRRRNAQYPVLAHELLRLLDPNIHFLNHPLARQPRRANDSIHARQIPTQSQPTRLHCCIYSRVGRQRLADAILGQPMRLRVLEQTALLGVRVALAFERVATREYGARVRVDEERADAEVCGFGRAFLRLVEGEEHVLHVVGGVGTHSGGHGTVPGADRASEAAFCHAGET